MKILNVFKKVAVFFVETLCSAVYRLRIFLQEKHVACRFVDCPPQPIQSLSVQKKYSCLDLLEHITYKDESWNYIRYLADYRQQMQQGNIAVYEDNECYGLGYKYQLCNNSILVNSPSQSNNWLCFYFHQLHPTRYVLTFDIEIATEFTEIQLAFRYQDLGNRYRFMIRNNREAVFECVYRGTFYHSIRQIPYHLELGIKNRIQLVVLDHQYQFIINDMQIFSIKETVPLVSGQTMSIILWNEHNNSPIQCTISDISLIELT